MCGAYFGFLRFEHVELRKDDDVDDEIFGDDDDLAGLGMWLQLLGVSYGSTH